jgi:hypothetical protein
MWRALRTPTPTWSCGSRSARRGTASTGGAVDTIPDTGFVKILFQATGVGPDGLPDEANPVVDWTPNVSELSAAGAGGLQFFRWEVEFNLDSEGVGLTVDTAPISLDFLRVPFSF